MPSTFTDALGLEKQATGENDNLWGTILNDDVIDLIDKAIAVRLAKSVAGASDVTLTTAEALNAYHEYTGTLTGNINVIVPATDKVYFIFNNTSGAFTLTVKTSAGTGVIVPQGGKTILYGDSTNVVGINTLPNLRQMKGADVASASDLLVNIDGTIFDVTGTTQIDTIASKGIGTVIKLHFDGILTLAHDATNLILPGGANITTAAGDEFEFYEYATADWRCTDYTPASGGVKLNADGGITLEDTDDGAGEGPAVIADRNSVSPLQSDLLGAFIWRGRNDAAEEVDYAKWLAGIADVTDASEDGFLRAYVMRAGTLTEIMRLIDGVQIGTPGDKGAGTLNAANGLYDNGVRLVLPRGAIDGLILSNNGVDAAKDIDIAVGEAVDDGGVVMMKLTGALTKQLDASWAVGTDAGALDGTESVAGTPDADTWYHCWLIRRSDTGVVDVLFSESATAPTMPSGSWDQKRLIGSVLFDATPDILAFTQYENGRVEWNARDASYSDTTPGTSAVLVTVATPLGLKTKALLSYSIRDNSLVLAICTSIDADDVAATASLHDIGSSNDTAGAANLERITDTSSQVRIRSNIGTGLLHYTLQTIGFVHPRGRNA